MAPIGKVVSSSANNSNQFSSYEFAMVPYEFRRSNLGKSDAIQLRREIGGPEYTCGLQDDDTSSSTEGNLFHEEWRSRIRQSHNQSWAIVLMVLAVLVLTGLLVFMFVVVLAWLRSRC